MNSPELDNSVPQRNTDSWNPPEDYYPWVSDKGVNRIFRGFVEPLAGTGMLLRYGNMKIMVPDSVKELAGSGQPCIVVPNHRDLSDTIAAPLMTKRAGIRLIRPLAKGNLFKNPALAWALHELGAVAVKRGGDDFDAIIEAQVRMIENGYSQMNFAEGTRRHSDVRTIGKLAGSVHRLAELTGAAVVPLGIAGFATEKTRDGKTTAADRTSLLGLGPKIVGRLGRPLYVDDRGRDEFMEEVRLNLQFCTDAAYEERGSSLEIHNLV